LAGFCRLVGSGKVTAHGLPIVLQIRVESSRSGQLGWRELLADALCYCVLVLNHFHLGHGQIALERAQWGRRVYSEDELRQILLGRPEGLSVAVY
jgi:hypothetical protein